MGTGAFLFIFAAVMFFAPDGGGYLLERPNFTPANPLVTPELITPAWYLASFYAMLRATPSMFASALPGVIVMFAAVLIIFFLPWLDKSPVKSIRYKGVYTKVALALFTVSYEMLTYLGLQHTTVLYTWLARIATIVYFLFFLQMPWYSRMDKTLPEPARVTE